LFSLLLIHCRPHLTRVQALQQQLSAMQAALPAQSPPVLELKQEPAFCSESEILRQRVELLLAEESRLSAAAASVHTWTLQQHEQLKAVNEDLPLAGDACVCLCWPSPVLLTRC
jgi:hypothetical protein